MFPLLFQTSMSKFMIKGYTCINCKNSYDNQETYNQHTEFCCKKNNDLLAMIQQLVQRVDKLEQDNQELRSLFETRNLHRPVQFDNVPEPSVSYDDWINFVLSSVKNELNTVFENDLLTGMNQLFRRAIDEFTSLPILVFDRKPQTFYYYIDSSWKVLENSDFENIMKRISYRFLADFNTEWYQVHKTKVKDSEEFNNLYIEYHKKILGGTRISDESRYQRVRHNIYNWIKTARS